MGIFGDHHSLTHGHNFKAILDYIIHDRLNFILESFFFFWLPILHSFNVFNFFVFVLLFLKHFFNVLFLLSICIISLVVNLFLMN
jgi:hypothetical protein